MKNFFKDENGQGMVEYGLILALIAIAVIAVLPKIGEKLTDIFEGAANALPEAASELPSGT